MSPSESKYQNRILALIASLIGLTYAWVGAGMSFIGDDILYYISPRDSMSSILGYPLWAARHFLHSNGRMANLLSPIFYVISPRWLFALVNGAFYAALYYLLARMMPWGKHTLTARLGVMALVAFTFPWWDVFMLFTVAINYVWSSVVALLFLAAIYKYDHVDSAPGRWGLLVLALLAGWMHEACGLPLAGALLVYAAWVKGWRSTSALRRKMIVACCIGAAVGMLSPGTWVRIFMEKIPDDTPLGLVLKSCWIGCALVVAVAVAWVARREKVVALMRTPFCVLFLATCASMCIVAAGGILWRSGFFAQVFALLAFGWWLRPKAHRLPRAAAATISTVLVGAVMFHFGAFCLYQTKMNAELSEALCRYAANPSESVVMPYHNEPDVPWHVLRKTRGVPDTDDFYILSTITDNYPHLTDPHPFGFFYEAHMPAPTSTVFPATFIPEGNGVWLDSLPASATPLRDSAGRYSVTIDGTEHIVTPLPNGRYFLNERDLDPSGSY